MNDNLPGRIARFNIVSELGRGAMGVVYRAEDPLLNREVAIKTILLSADESVRAEYEARFLQEAKAAGGLNHPGIVTTYDIGREGDLVYLAMELLDGEELRNLLARERLPLSVAIDIAIEVAEGLAYAHEHGVVHRDIKPANIMILRDRHAKIMDFGIAMLHVSDVKTQTGLLLGSPKYMSPEQIAGKTVDRRADIYSLGVVLYEMVAGVPPFAGEDVNHLMYEVCHGVHSPPHFLNPAVPAILELILDKALAKEPEKRYQDARELAADLRACREGLVELTATGGDTVPLGIASTHIQTEPAVSLTSTFSRLTFAEDARGHSLAISRRFDSGTALQRLVAWKSIAKFSRRNDRERLLVLAALAAAALAALAMTFYPA
jgi:serine/threonine-protein kinase